MIARFATFAWFSSPNASVTWWGSRMPGTAPHTMKIATFAGKIHHSSCRRPVTGGGGSSCPEAFAMKVFSVIGVVGTRGESDIVVKSSRRSL